MLLIDNFGRQAIAIVQSKVPDLTNRQTAMLMLVARRQGKPYTCRELADVLGVAKPIISRAADSLADLGLVVRKKDPNDGRSVLIDCGPKMSDYLAQLKLALLAARKAPPCNTLPDDLEVRMA